MLRFVLGIATNHYVYFEIYAVPNLGILSRQRVLQEHYAPPQRSAAGFADNHGDRHSVPGGGDQWESAFHNNRETDAFHATNHCLQEEL